LTLAGPDFDTAAKVAIRREFLQDFIRRSIKRELRRVLESPTR